MDGDDNLGACVTYKGGSNMNSFLALLMIFAFLPPSECGLSVCVCVCVCVCVQGLQLPSLFIP